MLFINKLFFVSFIFGVLTSNAMAAIIVDTTTTIIDLGTAFTAILFISFIVYGYRQIQSILDDRGHSWGSASSWFITHKFKK